MTRDNAIYLIKETIGEFHTGKMELVHEHINSYDKDTGSAAIELHEQYYTLKAAVEDMDNMTAHMGSMKNFELSQLLSLCRDIA